MTATVPTGRSSGHETARRYRPARPARPVQPAAPPADSGSHLWVSDREIGALGPRARPRYSASDYRDELKRVTRKRFWLAFAAVAVAVVAIALAVAPVVGALFPL